LRDGGAHARNQWPKVNHAISNAHDQNDSDSDRPEVLLMLQCLVRGYEDFKPGVDGGAQ